MNGEDKKIKEMDPLTDVVSSAFYLESNMGKD